MTTRLATIGLVATFLVFVNSPSLSAQLDVYANATLEGISAVHVLVEDLHEGVGTTLGLTKEAIQTDVELKLRLAGVRVVTREERSRLPGRPYLYVNVNADRWMATIRVELAQDVLLTRNDEPAGGVSTWSAHGGLLNPTAQGIRDIVKDRVDQFLNAWLSVNPKQ